MERAAACVCILYVCVCVCVAKTNCLHAFSSCVRVYVAPVASRVACVSCAFVVCASGCGPPAYRPASLGASGWSEMSGLGGD